MWNVLARRSVGSNSFSSEFSALYSPLYNAYKKGWGKGGPLDTPKSGWLLLNLEGPTCGVYSFQCQLKEKVLITYLATQALSQNKNTITQFGSTSHVLRHFHMGRCSYVDQ